MTQNEYAATAGPAIDDPIVNYYEAAAFYFGKSRSAAERMRRALKVETFRLGRERLVQHSEMRRLVATAKAAEAAKSAVAD